MLPQWLSLPQSRTTPTSCYYRLNRGVESAQHLMSVVVFAFAPRHHRPAGHSQGCTGPLGPGRGGEEVICRRIRRAISISSLRHGCSGGSVALKSSKRKAKWGQVLEHPFTPHSQGSLGRCCEGGQGCRLLSEVPLGACGGWSLEALSAPPAAQGCQVLHPAPGWKLASGPTVHPGAVRSTLPTHACSASLPHIRKHTRM